MIGDGRFLLIDSDAAHARAVASVLQGPTRQVVSTATLAEAPLGAFDVVIGNFDGLGPSGAAELLTRFRDLHARGRVLLFIGNADRAALARLFGECGLSNVLARGGDVDGTELKVTIGKMLRGDVFGLDKYFPTCSLKREFSVRGSTEREQVLASTREFAVEAGAQGRFAELLCKACDELITNALYNAPVDSLGKPRFAHLSRTQAVLLEAHEAVRVVLATDGRDMGIAVTDPFGSLKVPTITQYLAKCLRRGSDLVDEKEGGAGLGLFYVFEAVSHFVVNLQVGVRTEMIGIVDVKGRYKDFVLRPKSFNVFLAQAP